MAGAADIGESSCRMQNYHMEYAMDDGGRVGSQKQEKKVENMFPFLSSARQRPGSFPPMTRVRASV